MTEESVLPDPPSFSEAELEACEKSGDYRPILFEWYKFVGSVNVVIAHIQRDSPAFKAIPEIQFYILTGLLNRCARLILSNVALSHEGKFGETTAIVDRCIFESAVKISWLCNNPSDEKFRRYLADGLKTELEFKGQIEANIAARDGEKLPIEHRMLTSIANHIQAAGLSEAEIESEKRLPDLASMLSAIGLNRLVYVTAQKLGSHHIHGTWPSLLFHYLEEEPAGSRKFAPRGHDCSTHVNQCIFVPLMILQSLADYVRFALQSPESNTFEDLLDGTHEEIRAIASKAWVDDSV